MKQQVWRIWTLVDAQVVRWCTTHKSRHWVAAVAPIEKLGNWGCPRRGEPAEIKAEFHQVSSSGNLNRIDNIALPIQMVRILGIKEANVSTGENVHSCKASVWGHERRE